MKIVLPELFLKIVEDALELNLELYENGYLTHKEYEENRKKLMSLVVP